MELLTVCSIVVLKLPSLLCHLRYKIGKITTALELQAWVLFDLLLPCCILQDLSRQEMLGSSPEGKELAKSRVRAPGWLL